MNRQCRFLSTHVIVVGLLLMVILTLALPSFAQGDVTVIANANLSLRASPDRNFTRLGTVPYNTELAASAISTDRNWVAVVYNGQGGWMSLAYTGVVRGSLGALNVSTQTFTAGGSGVVASSVVVAPTINLRYRTNPTLDERPMGAIPNQTQVPALALSSDGLFVLVNYNGQNVWVYRQYVQEVSGSLSSFVPGAAPAAAEVLAADQPEAPAAVPSNVEVTFRDDFDETTPVGVAGMGQWINRGRQVH